ncbi:hypothetical protein HQ520_05250 [bacterium]|nr:hypothetical protein [bacterium]
MAKTRSNPRSKAPALDVNPSIVDQIIQFPQLREAWSRRIHENPVKWAEKLFGIKLWTGQDPAVKRKDDTRRFEHPGQAELLESIFKHPYTCAGTGHRLGKTFLTTIIPPLWLLAHYSCGFDSMLAPRSRFVY